MFVMCQTGGISFSFCSLTTYIYLSGEVPQTLFAPTDHGENSFFNFIALEETNFALWIVLLIEFFLNVFLAFQELFLNLNRGLEEVLSNVVGKGWQASCMSCRNLFLCKGRIVCFLPTN